LNILGIKENEAVYYVYKIFNHKIRRINKTKTTMEQIINLD